MLGGTDGRTLFCCTFAGDFGAMSGGARNAGLMRDLADALRRPVRATDEAGVAAQWMEALAFAWLAQMHVDGLKAGVPEVTGARGPRVLGALYPA